MTLVICQKKRLSRIGYNSATSPWVKQNYWRAQFKSEVGRSAQVGVLGEGKNKFGVYGRSEQGIGLRGHSADGTGVYGTVGNPKGLAGRFKGGVLVDGDLTVTGAKGAVVPNPDGSQRLFCAIESPRKLVRGFRRRTTCGWRCRDRVGPEFRVDDAHGFIPRLSHPLRRFARAVRGAPHPEEFHGSRAARRNERPVFFVPSRRQATRYRCPAVQEDGNPTGRVRWSGGTRRDPAGCRTRSAAAPRKRVGSHASYGGRLAAAPKGRDSQSECRPEDGKAIARCRALRAPVVVSAKVFPVRHPQRTTSTLELMAPPFEHMT